jgi:hypothetical protein
MTKQKRREKAYVYMKGENGVSREFRTKKEAIKEARKYALKKSFAPVEIDHVDNRGQGLEVYVMPFKTKKEMLKKVV